MKDTTIRVDLAKSIGQRFQYQSNLQRSFPRLVVCAIPDATEPGPSGYHSIWRPDMLKLVEERSGVGQLEAADDVFPRVRYKVARYQGFAESGMPIPGLFRLEGSIDMASVIESGRLVGSDLTLRLESGRALRVTLADSQGRILTEGHGPTRCQCC